MDLPLRLALFDCDGTLVDSQHAIVAAMSVAWQREGLPAPDGAAVRRVVGLSLVEAVAALAPELAPARHQRLADHYRDAFMAARGRHQDHETLYPGMREALEQLDQAGLLLGVATGKSLAGLHTVLQRHQLARHFVTLQTADQGPGKPDPAMVERALTETGVVAAAAVMIGDTTYDIEMARRAGVAAIGVAWGYHEPAALREAGADRIVASAAELVEAVLALLGVATPDAALGEAGP